MSERISLPGLTLYREVHATQLRCVEERIVGERGDTVIFAEHFPIVTRGRGLQMTATRQNQERHAPLLAELPEGVECVDVERGGDLTYHGPGQLVVYPIVHLGERDIHAHLRKLERAVSQELERWGVPIHADPDATGVWVTLRGERRKVASIGIAVRKWVTYHGMGLNLTTELAHFSWITPCGFAPEIMTSMAELATEYPRIPEAALQRPYWEQVIFSQF